MKTTVFAYVSLILCATAWGIGEFNILHSPNGINFRGDEQLSTSELPKIISTAMGYTTTVEDSWNGLTILNPFNYPNVAVTIVVKGIQSLPLSESRYPLESSSELDQVKNALASIVGEVVFDENDLYSGEKKSHVHLEKLVNHNEGVKAFLKDISILRDLKEKILSKSSIKLVWTQLNGLDQIVREFGQNSEETVEAVNILKSSLTEIEDALEKVYGDKFILTAITETENSFRTKRQAPPTPPEDNSYALNLSKRYGSDYAAIFNILLWTSVFLIAALISTAVFICTLDPGRDSIIYRMTTQRIKKEN